MPSTKNTPSRINISDTQLILLSEASQRPDHLVILPARLTGGAGASALQALARRGLIEHDPNQPNSEVGGPSSLPLYRITAAALRAIGVTDVESEAMASPDITKPGARESKSRGKSVAKAKPHSPPKPKAKRIKAFKEKKKGNAKQDTLIALLKRAKGATLEELTTAVGWQAHSIRGFLSGTIKSKLGFKLDRSNDPKRGSSYRIID